jgi:serine/threonine-protein kinase
MLILGPWATEAHLKRFKTEAEAAANLDHPQIVPIYEIGQVQGQHYFTMKLVEGPSLKQLVISRPLAPRRAAELLAGAARAIHHAHERGILHRDLKPGNILLDEKGQPQVTDFGLAKLVEDESTITNTMDVLGTPSYLSPEQATGQAKSLTKACDIYGLGAVFYELLTGNPPFAGGTTMETIRQVVEKEPRRPSLWNPKLDREVETICLKCLQKEPHLRYESAAALAMI